MYMGVGLYNNALIQIFLRRVVQKSLVTLEEASHFAFNRYTLTSIRRGLPKMALPLINGDQKI